jgi:hypothetical protein
LDPERLLGVLIDDARGDVPRIPGWHIAGVAGEGGSGIVWRGERISDGTAAAIKIASPDEPETVEGIEREAGFLRELRHPHIVKLLETGPVPQGPDEGGLYLAMEFIDGPALVHEIPEHGLPPAQAYRWFREIAAAVAHAHDAGILHRDLKPANVLVTPDGHIKVADFGLARPVHRRVHMLSLTRAGLVAGTAEYLPPEAYRRDYRPNPAADIFALGVILHEMLTGTPPRGAWQPASTREGVDVRVDQIIRRAMDPDPALRWPDVQSLIKELDAVLASPPRLAGTPLVNFPIRVGDCVWTLIGLVVLLAGTSSLMRLEKSRISLPLDLIGDQGRLTGAFHALFVLLLATMPLIAWQLARLRRFRGVPLREALPSPFGLKLGHTRMAAGLVAISQFLLVWLPALQMFTLFLTCCLTWLTPTDRPWVHGLAVTGIDDYKIISPWQFARSGGGFWLWESFGPPGGGFAKPVDRITFFPFISPAIMAFAGTLVVATLGTTVWIACRSWWRRNHRVRALGLASATLALAVLLGASHAREARRARENRSPDLDNWVVDAFMTSHLRDLADFLLGARDRFPDGDDGIYWTTFYHETVDYRDHGTVARGEIPQLLKESRPRADSIRVNIDRYDQSWDPKTGEFHVLVLAVETFDGLQPDGTCGAADLRIELSGTLDVDGGTAIRKETFRRTPMYLADCRKADAREVSAWAESFHHAFRSASAGSGDAGRALRALFHPVPGGSPDETDSGWVRKSPDLRSGFPSLLGAELSQITHLDAVIVETLPGGRTRIQIPLESNGSRPKRMITADLASIDGTWRCVKLAF